ncbi:MAG: pantoate--beta-alanine ligase [Actinobacteria bacterium]|uniref:pantoate--beta-alanine ligase (AMP-forming) n=1 Tax=freshwater metagenome TaxID=449393 RepID=A0A6J6C657_9ZZZZ|nr:pantoate--beta-alanine ligase [Actinomycetota bacterium]
MKLIQSATELQKLLDIDRAEGKTIGFVPTMGALHQGHISLVRLAQKSCDVVVVSIYVNPLQFGPEEDFEKYPRTLNQDQELLEANGVQYLFAPTVEEIYPNGTEITQRAGVVGSTFEGASRPGHFDGMLTVVNRLMEIVQPNAVVFGEKDAQQVFIVKKLIGARFRDCEFIEGPTLREESGLALSSRNRFLRQEERSDAESIYHHLSQMKTQLEAGAAVSEVIAEHTKAIETAAKAKLEYLAVIDPQLFRPVDDKHRGPAKIIVAAKVGEVRLIDNLNVKAING